MLRNAVAAIHPRVAVVIHDLGMVALAWWLAKVLRYSLQPDELVTFRALEFPIVLLTQGLVMRWTGLYKSVWRFASLPDLWNILRAATVGTVTIALLLFVYDRLDGVPRSVLVLYAALLTVLLGSPRLAYRFWKDSRAGLSGGQDVKRVLIVGADRAGEVLSRDLQRDSGYQVVGFVDDNPGLRGAIINGRPVLGRIEHLSTLVQAAAVQMLLIALPEAIPARCAASSPCVMAPVCRIARYRGWKMYWPVVPRSVKSRRWRLRICSVAMPWSWIGRPFTVR